MAMVWKATLTMPWDGRDFETLDRVRKAMMDAADNLELPEIGYEEQIVSVREKKEG